MHANFLAVAVIAFGAPSRFFNLLQYAPIPLLLLDTHWAAILKAFAARAITLRVLVPNTFSPVTLLAGLSPNQEVKCFSDGHLSWFKPTSEIIVCIVSTSSPGTLVKSIPVTLYSSSCKGKSGLFFENLFFILLHRLFSSDFVSNVL
ncbi:hypothetical protein [Wolbachia sp. wKue]|nr:hypothetical protein [Wolbachia sp. wKue] [Wolbachia phage WO]